MSETPDLSLVIVNFNSAHFVERLVESIRAQDWAVDGRPGRLEMIVIDNASKGEDAAELEAMQADDLHVVVNTVNTGYGQAILQLDTKSTEIHGFLPNTNPTVYVHLKKVPEPPAPDYELEAISVDNGEVSLRGHLHRPKYRPSRTALIIVGGRGCYAGNTKYDLYARTLHPYGVSVLAYHKRGTGQSTGDCSTATLEDLADDFSAVYRYLLSNRRHEVVSLDEELNIIRSFIRLCNQLPHRNISLGQVSLKYGHILPSTLIRILEGIVRTTIPTYVDPLVIDIIEKEEALAITYMPEEKLQHQFTKDMLSFLEETYRYYSNLAITINEYDNRKEIKLPKLNIS